MKSTQFFLMLFFCLVYYNLNAQLNIGKKLKNQTNNRANKEVNQEINKGLNSVESGVKDIFKKNKAPVAPQPQPPNDTLSKGEFPQSPKDPSDTGTAIPLQAYSKFDFIPGEKVIFFEDFSQDKVGDFPALWNTNGSAEVVTTNLFPGNWMRFVTRDAIWSDDLLKLPDNYTIEFDVIPIQGEEKRMAGYQFRLMQATNIKAFDHGSAPGKGGFLFAVEYFGRPSFSTWFNQEGCPILALRGSKDDVVYKEKENQKYHIALWAQKSRIRLYQDQNKLFDLPKAMPVECIKIDRIRFEEGAAMISNVRIAVGAPDMRNKLITDGKLVTYGIYFDVNKDEVKPESYGTLKEIAAILNEVPDVNVNIVGHTDSDGDDIKNIDLSKRRAAAVKTELARSFGVNGDRLVTDGLGESKPVAPNDSPVNKALNRRVEFIKL